MWLVAEFDVTFGVEAVCCFPLLFERTYLQEFVVVCCCYERKLLLFTAAVILLLLDPLKGALVTRRRLLLQESAGVFCCGTLGRELSRSADIPRRIPE